MSDTNSITNSEMDHTQIHRKAALVMQQEAASFEATKKHKYSTTFETIASSGAADLVLVSATKAMAVDVHKPVRERIKTIACMLKAAWTSAGNKLPPINGEACMTTTGQATAAIGLYFTLNTTGLRMHELNNSIPEANLLRTYTGKATTKKNNIVAVVATHTQGTRTPPAITEVHLMRAMNPKGYVNQQCVYAPEGAIIGWKRCTKTPDGVDEWFVLEQGPADCPMYEGRDQDRHGTLSDTKRYDYPWDDEVLEYLSAWIAMKTGKDWFTQVSSMLDMDDAKARQNLTTAGGHADFGTAGAIKAATQRSFEESRRRDAEAVYDRRHRATTNLLAHVEQVTGDQPKFQRVTGYPEYNEYEADFLKAKRRAGTARAEERDTGPNAPLFRTTTNGDKKLVNRM